MTLKKYFMYVAIEEQECWLVTGGCVCRVSITKQHRTKCLSPRTIINQTCANRFANIFHKRFDYSISTRPQWRNPFVMNSPLSKIFLYFVALEWRSIITTNAVWISVYGKHFVETTYDVRCCVKNVNRITIVLH